MSTTVVIRPGKLAGAVTPPPSKSQAHRLLIARALAGDPAVISGESGGVTMGLLDLLMTAPDLAPLRRDMGLNRQSVVLLISTEGDTDPVHYQKVMTHD